MSEPKGFERSRPIGEIVARAKHALSESPRLAVEVYCWHDDLVGELFETNIGAVWKPKPRSLRRMSVFEAEQIARSGR